MDEAVILLEKMEMIDCPLNVVVYTTLINGLCRTGNTNAALTLHQKMVKEKSGEFDFNCKPNVVTYTALIDGLCNEGLMDKTKQVFIEMKTRGLLPNVFTYGSLIRCLCFANEWEEVKNLLSEMFNQGARPNVLIFNTLIDALCKQAKINEQRVFVGFIVMGSIYRSGCKPDVVTFTALIKGLCLLDKIYDAIRIFHNMGAVGCAPDVVTYNTLMNGLRRTGHTNVALRLFEEMVKMKSKFGINCKPDAVSYNTIINGLCQDDLIGNAKQIFTEMKERGISPNVFTYNTLLRGLCFVGEWELAKDLLFTYTTLMNGFCLIGSIAKAGKFEIAWKLFSEFCCKDLEPTIVTYTILVHGLCKMEEVIELLHKMKERNVFPNDFTVSVVMRLLVRVENCQEYINLLPTFPMRKSRENSPRPCDFGFSRKT